MGGVKSEIKKVRQILGNDMRIPIFQRPYRWTDENVRLLLEDIYHSWKAGKTSYRIGSIIFYDDENEVLNIVDGQQRITTILLVLKALDSEAGNNLRANLKYKHEDSKTAIHQNFQFIKKWLKENSSNELKDFETYLLDYCEFVEITVTELSEAFQMFDSQNGRGKELEAYNLLKAYHIRAMESNTIDEKIEVDRRWEAATRIKREEPEKKKEWREDLLSQIINEQLYRTRLWSKKEAAQRFDKNHLKEFKGVTINKNEEVNAPYQNRELLHFISQNYFKTLGVNINGSSSRFENLTFHNISPFTQINQKIINGKDFFDYVETYAEIYKQLFHPEVSQLGWLKDFINNYCLYPKSYRDGDTYLFELYKSLLILIFDRFGEKGLKKYYRTLYLIVYRLRLEKEQVRYVTVSKYPTEKNIFQIIENAVDMADLAVLEKMAYRQVDCKKDVKEVIKCFSLEGVNLNISKIQNKKEEY